MGGRGMRPEFGDSYRPDFAGRPAHMSMLDFVLWGRLQKAEVLPWARVFFDVAVGPGAAPVGDADAKVLASWARITRHRIDVLGEDSGGWTIVEVRNAAGPGAIGSLLTYGTLWADDPPDARRVLLWLVTDQFPVALESVTRKYGIRVVVV